MVLIGGCILLYAGLALYRRLGGGGGGLRSGSKRQIRVAETVALGGRRFLCAVEARDRTLLLGIAGDRIQLLTELDDGGSGLPFDPASMDGADAIPFGDQFDHAMTRPNDTARATEGDR